MVPTQDDGEALFLQAAGGAIPDRPHADTTARPWQPKQPTESTLDLVLFTLGVFFLGVRCHCCRGNPKQPVSTALGGAPGRVVAPDWRTRKPTLEVPHRSV